MSRFRFLFIILTANCNGGNGVSNCGAISRSGSCFTPNASYSPNTSGTENKVIMFSEYGCNV